jgi:ABC-2 type transport system ATP-binding protein
VKAIDAMHVTKVYKNAGQAALKDFSLKVDTGKVFTLLGRNGAGKTTFIRICATQLLPTAGEIRILGYDAIRQPERVRDLICIVPQESRPLRALTPWDHVYNWLQIRGDSKRVARDKATEILLKLDLYDARDRPAMNLSGGMKQKILVAMAMATDAQLLFLDEPTIGLDPVSRRQVWAAMLSDYVVIIDKGMIVAQGTIQDLRKVIPQNIRVDISRDGLDAESLRSYGSVVDTGSGTLRVFTFESAAKDLSDLAIQKNLSFTVSSVTLDDVFVRLVGDGIGDDPNGRK